MPRPKLSKITRFVHIYFGTDKRGGKGRKKGGGKVWETHLGSEGKRMDCLGHFITGHGKGRKKGEGGETSPRNQKRGGYLAHFMPYVTCRGEKKKKEKEGGWDAVASTRTLGAHSTQCPEISGL